MLNRVIAERIRKRYPESISEQLYVQSVGLIGFIPRFPRLVSSAQRLFFRCQAPYLSTVDPSSA